MADTTPTPAGAAAAIPATATPAAVRYVKRGKYRLPEALPNHEQATLDLLNSLPVHGLPATTVRELLHAMACALVRIEWKRRNTPDERISDPGVVQAWYATYAAQAKALLYATRNEGDHYAGRGAELHPDMPAPAPLVLNDDDFRARYLALYGDGELTMALKPLTAGDASDEIRERLAEAAYALYEDLIRAGAVLTQAPVVPWNERNASRLAKEVQS